MSRIDDASHEEKSVMTRRKLLVDDLIQSRACWVEREMLLSVPREEIEALRTVEMVTLNDMLPNAPAFALA